MIIKILAAISVMYIAEINEQLSEGAAHCDCDLFTPTAFYLRHGLRRRCPEGIKAEKIKTIAVKLLIRHAG